MVKTYDQPLTEMGLKGPTEEAKIKPLQNRYGQAPGNESDAPNARFRSGAAVYDDGVASIETIRAGLIDYQVAWDWQRKLHAQRVSGEIGDTALLLQHPPVYTAGKRTESHERPFDGTPVIEVDRGGKITWHGPGQLVGYPIIALRDPIDVLAYVRATERMLMNVCADLGLSTTRLQGSSGVWLTADSNRPQRKIAAIGIRVARGVTLHGFALNCNPDLSWFERIVPCGIADATVTSLSAELGRDVTVDEVIPLVQARIAELTDAYAEPVAS